MQQNELETAVYGVGNAVDLIESRQSGLRHDHAIQGGDGVVRPPPPKKRKNHWLRSPLEA
jgi:hypothetical protein